jgi:large subunit ribosomal protein L32
MAHPKRRHSSTRRDKRRTHDALTTRQLSVDSSTGETHQLHRAHVHEGNLYYKGKVVVEGYTKTV